jgi:peptidoglycan/LPS O-acetylase OafA/YrhL
MQPNTPARFATLDGMRGVAAIIVLLWHSTDISVISVPQGYLAVDLFFVLSGFVLAGIYVPKFERGMGLWSFMKVRAKRLYPLYFIGIMLGFIARSQQDVRGALLYVPLGLLGLPTPGAPGEYMYALNPPSWSLFAEWLINVAFFIWLWKLQTRWLLVVIAASATIVCVSYFHYGHIDAGARVGDAWVGWARVGFSFPMGMVLQRFHQHHDLGRFRHTPNWIGFFIPIVMVALFWRVNALFVSFVAFPLIVLAGATFEPIAYKLWLKLGAMSYLLYCVHIPILMVVRHIAIRTDHPQIVGMIGIITILAAAWMTEKTLDRQIARRLSRVAAA